MFQELCTKQAMFQEYCAFFKGNVQVTRTVCIATFQEYCACFKRTVHVSGTVCMFEGQCACLKSNVHVLRTACMFQLKSSVHDRFMKLASPLHKTNDTR